jgi:hypothetical protein
MTLFAALMDPYGEEVSSQRVMDGSILSSPVHQLFIHFISDS